MKTYTADLHIHSLLSPCADLYMAPQYIAKQIKKTQLDIVSITDHNSTLQSEHIYSLIDPHKTLCIWGVEVCSKEEIHALCYFFDTNHYNTFQTILDKHSTTTPNIPKYMGDQYIVDKNHNILSEVSHWLGDALTLSIDQLVDSVHTLNGWIVPAHIDRPSYSIVSQLGFIPPHLEFDALEVSPNISAQELKLIQSKYNLPILCNSDAHFIDQIGETTTLLEMEELSIAAFKDAITKRRETPIISKR